MLESNFCMAKSKRPCFILVLDSLILFCKLPFVAANFFLCSRRKKPQLSVVAVQTTNIPPKENVTYSKNTQTLESGEFSFYLEFCCIHFKAISAILEC
jgi:hypothetical protein